MIGSRLTLLEIARCQHGVYTDDALLILKNYQYSNRDSFSLCEQDIEELANRLQVGKSILTFNAGRLRSICYTLLAHHEKFRRQFLGRADVALNDLVINSKQMAILFEFYLQIDGISLFFLIYRFQKEEEKTRTR